VTDPLERPSVTEATCHPWWLPRTVRVRDVVAEIEGVATYGLQCTDPAVGRQYHFAPGQFNMLNLPGAGEVAISVSGEKQADGTVPHTIRAAGNVTRGIAALRSGETLGLRGPFGSSWPLGECIGRDVVIVAGGIGLAPLRPVISHLLARRQDYANVNLLYGARSPESRLFAPEYDTWTDRGLVMQTTVDRSSPGWRGHVGVVPLLLERNRTFDPRSAILLCCGPEVMMRYTIKTALQRGMETSRIWVSLERNMQCAVGLCGHCQLGPEFICKDGPIFRYDRVARWLRVEGL